jgi:hypothetical protein
MKLLLGSLRFLVTGLLHLVLAGASLLLRVVVFRPLTLLPMAAAFVDGSRTLALTAAGGVVGVSALRALWPALTGTRVADATSGVVVRAVVAAAAMGLLPAGVRLLFRLNNLIVTAFEGTRWFPATSLGPGLLASAPLWLLALLVVVVILVVYLSLLYVTRLIHIVWLAGLIPWFLLWWLVSGDDARLGVQVRELVALSLTQAVQALAWWLAVEYVRGAGTMAGLVFATGSLWFMVMVPHEFRRLLGLGALARPRVAPW